MSDPRFLFIYGLTILFIGLKLTGIIEGPWIWVLSPVLIPIAVGLLVLALIAFVMISMMFIAWVA